MRIGITFDLKADLSHRPDLPDDFQEEYDSPATVEAIASALRDLGHDVFLLGDGRELLTRLLADPPEFVFNFAEGQGIGRDREARVPAVLEMLGIPYTGSDPLTMAATLDKEIAKRLVHSAGVAIPRGVLVDDSSSLNTLPFPVIVKPAWEGSSKGIRTKCLVDRREDLEPLVASMRADYRQPLLVEEYIVGDELTVGLLGNAPPTILGVMRVVPKQRTERFVYGLEIKRDFRRLVDYECPAPLTPEAYQAVCTSARIAWDVLGCRDVARIDFRLRDGVPYFLEVNPLPGLHPEDSDLVIMAKLVGWDHARLVRTIFEAARARHERAS